MIDLKRQAELHAAIELMFHAYRAFTAPPDAILAQRGLGRVHHRILYFVARNPGITVSALLGVLGVSKQALNAPLRQLVDAGLITTSTSDRDRRSKLLDLSTTGLALEAELSGTQMARLDALFQQAGPGAEAAWREVMAALRDSAQRGPAPMP
ncbi:MarR family winged helix-turn-helix transcriptional regulator [Zoogloea sp.]|uniref:MarR family winged helix-turn-helix transcriptional regulator n=1 Tax=Zoogloea sp. TaxID=49181 RepID=UPI0035B26DB8|nr:MarR family transcriptional regulator [Rhodocyclales bacterium]